MNTDLKLKNHLDPWWLKLLKKEINIFWFLIPLIILLISLFCSPLFSQTIIKRDAFLYSSSVPVTTADLLEYKQTCYNDSTLSVRHWNKKEMWAESVKYYKIQDSIAKANNKYYPQEIFSIACVITSNGACNDIKHYIEYYTHKEPTFIGFIEWITNPKRKIKTYQ